MYFKNIFAITDMQAFKVSTISFFVFLGLIMPVPPCLAAAKDAKAAAPAGRQSVLPPPSARFLDNGNGTVLDKSTGLLWLKDANAGGKHMPVQSARQHIKDMNAGKLKNFGYADWRIPSIEELEGLIDRSELYPSIYKGHPFENVKNSFYWSSTGGTNIAEYVWVADMASGDIKMEYVSYCSLQYLWPVRGAYKAGETALLKPARLQAAGAEESDSAILLSAAQSQLEEKLKLEAALNAAREQLEKEKSKLEETKRKLEKKQRQNSPPELRASAVSPFQIDLSWDALAEAKIAGYNVYRDGVFQKAVKGASFMQSDLKPDTKYCFAVTAFDSGGNETKHSQNICKKTLAAPDGEPPSVPSALIVNGVTPSRIELSWKSSTDNVAVKGYKVYLDDALLKEAEGTVAAMTDLKPNATYCYVVTAVDVTGNESAHSQKACAKTLYEDKNRPSVPIGLTASEHGDRMDMSWTASYDDVGVSAYTIYQDGVVLRSVQGVSALNIPLKRTETHCYTVSASDAAGNESRRSSPICFLKTGESRDKTDADVGGKWGTIWAGGYNKFGQLGVGTVEDKQTLVMINGLFEAIRVAASAEHTLALRADGTVWAWGRNDKGQLGDGTVGDSVSPVQVKELKNAVELAAGKSHSVALKSDGTVWTWGRNYYGQLGDHTLADRLTPVQVKNLTDVVAVSAGWYHTVALKSDGTVWAWGWNGRGELGDGTTNNSIKPLQVKGLAGMKAIAAGMDHTVALKSDGAVWAWGRNDSGQLGIGSAADSLWPVQIRDLSGIDALGAGMDHTVALKSDGTVWAWGKNDYGQIGTTSGTMFVSPLRVEGIENVKEVAAGAHHTVALKHDGSVWAWGWRLTRNFQQDAVPVQISGLTDVSNIAAGKRYTVVIKGAENR